MLRGCSATEFHCIVLSKIHGVSRVLGIVDPTSTHATVCLSVCLHVCPHQEQNFLLLCSTTARFSRCVSADLLQKINQFALQPSQHELHSTRMQAMCQPHITSLLTVRKARAFSQSTVSVSECKFAHLRLQSEVTASGRCPVEK